VPWGGSSRRLVGEAVLDAVSQAILATDPAGIIMYWNAAAERLYGWPRSDAVGRSSRALICPEQTAAEAEANRESIRRGESWSGGYWVTRGDGTRVPVYVTDTPVLDRDGGLVAVIRASVDVTERRAGEDARRQLVAIVEGSGDAIFGTTTNGMVTSWNPAAESLFGYTAEQIIGRPMSVLAPDERVEEQAGMRARLNNGGPHERLETVRRRRDGSVVEVLITASTATDEAGTAVGLSVIARDITEEREAQRALEASQRRLDAAQRIARLGSFEFDLVTRVLTWSAELYRVLGIDPSLEPSGALLLSTLHPDDLEALRQAWIDTTTQGTPFDIVHRIIRADFEERYVRARTVAERAPDGTVAKVVGTLMDDTERVEADRVRRAAETRFEIGFEQAAIGAIISNLEGIPLRVNPAACVLLGQREGELIGRPWTGSHPDEVPLGRAVMARVTAGHDTYADERRYPRPDGTMVWAQTDVTLVRDEAGAPQYFFAQLQDITERKRMERELAHQALHDSLTGLPNRVLLTDRLVHGLAGSRRRGSRLGVMFVDIDHFKAVNDSLGHTIGDDLLARAAERISAAIRPGDTVARFGGDEFVVVCDDVSVLKTEQIAGRVLASLSRPYLIGSHEVNASASLGLAVADEDATPESLLRDADAAMYRAKERGRGRIESFDHALRSKAQRRLALTSALRHALERDEFAVDYQPIVNLSSGIMEGAEALVRWHHPALGLVAPDEFIPLAEESGVIVPLGAWVLEQACRELAGWQAGAPALTVAVNLSVRQVLTPDLAGVIASVLRRTGVRPADLCLELTESMFIDDADYAGRMLAGLKSLGVRLAIDDFGTGYSSLSYLKRYPVDAVKVDRAFVDGLGTDPHDSALVAAIVAMADALGLEVTAEGVETGDQLANLRRLQCRRAQGFYLAPPMPAAELTKLVAESHRWHVG